LIPKKKKKNSQKKNSTIFLACKYYRFDPQKEKEKLTKKYWCQCEAS